MRKPSTVLTVVIALLNAVMLAQTTPAQAPVASTNSAAHRPVLEDGTPVKLRIGRTVSSADAHVGDTVDFEVLEEVRVRNELVIPKGGTALATVTDAKPKGHMGKGGKLDINIDSVRLADGEKAALRAVKDVKGGGHGGAMTGAMVATGLVFFPAAPLFLFMHGKDITIPKGTEVTAYVNGDFPIDITKFQQGSVASTTVALVGNAVTEVGNAVTELEISSAPAGADITIDGSFAGNTPSTVNIPSGEHVITVTMAGYQTWERKLRASGGKVKLAAALEARTSRSLNGSDRTPVNANSAGDSGQTLQAR